MTLEDFANRIDEMKCARDLFTAFKSAVSDEGFDRFAYLNLAGTGGSASPLMDAETEAPFINSNFPVEWRLHYRRKGYIDIDPVFAEASNTLVPFTWDSIANKRTLPSKQRRLFAEAQKFGLISGVTVPLHGPRGNAALISFTSEQRTPIAKLKIRRLASLAGQLHIAFAEMTNAFSERSVTLSVRERECLAWTARGKSSWETGKILGLSENTINFHLKNAMRKLHASSRTVAALKAMQLGLINVRF